MAFFVLCLVMQAEQERTLMDTTKIPAVLALLAMLVTALPGPVRAGDVADRIEKPVNRAVRIERDTQAGEAAWQEEKKKKIRQFEALETEVAALEANLARQSGRNGALKKRIDEKNRQLADIRQISGQISPFLDQLLARLREVKNRDLPFLNQEREKRLASLADLNGDPEVPVSEKYRKIMEALLVEAEYGRSVEVFQQTVDLSGQKTLVNVLRLGRLSLFYQTLDRQGCGFYNPAQAAWVPLDKTHLRSIQAAVDMGAKRRPVEILDLPLGRIAVQ